MFNKEKKLKRRILFLLISKKYELLDIYVNKHKKYISKNNLFENNLFTIENIHNYLIYLSKQNNTKFIFLITNDLNSNRHIDIKTISEILDNVNSVSFNKLIKEYVFTVDSCVFIDMFNKTRYKFKSIEPLLEKLSFSCYYYESNYAHRNMRIVPKDILEKLYNEKMFDIILNITHNFNKGQSYDINILKDIIDYLYDNKDFDLIYKIYSNIGGRISIRDYFEITDGKDLDIKNNQYLLKICKLNLDEKPVTIEQFTKYIEAITLDRTYKKETVIWDKIYKIKDYKLISHFLTSADILSLIRKKPNIQ